MFDSVSQSVEIPGQVCADQVIWKATRILCVERIDENLFLKTLLMRLRGETIKFASQLKRNQNAKEKQLTKEITDLEKSKNIFAVIDLLHGKKDELEQLREVKMKGHLVRSRDKWLQHGEKPSKLFCLLENKHFTEKQ